MRVPILKQGAYLIASVQSALSDSEWLALRDELARKVGEHRSRGVVVDLTVLDVLDSYATRMLLAIAHILRLRGARAVIVGIQPEVAFAMVQLGITLSEVETALDLEEGMASLDRRAREDESRGRTDPNGR